VCVAVVAAGALVEQLERPFVVARAAEETLELVGVEWLKRFDGKD